MLKFKKLLKLILIIIVVGGVAYLTYDYKKYTKSYQAISEKLVTQTADDILLLNADLKNKISQLLIKHLDLFIKLANTPEDSELISQADILFKQQLPSFYTFSLADQHGEIMTDIFFEKVGRLCRQDIKQFALNESNTWLTIHPGLGKYHYDLLLPWQYAETKKIMFISFDIDSLVDILKKNKRENHELFLVRKDKNNLVELSSSGSRADLYKMNSGIFLDDKHLQGFSQDISNTYWTVIELPQNSLFNFYIKQLYNKVYSQLSYITGLF
jgi:hypothetical protein